MYFLHISRDRRDISFLPLFPRKARYCISSISLKKGEMYFLHISHERRDIAFLPYLSRKARYRISSTFLTKAKYRIFCTSLPKSGMYYFLYLSLERQYVYFVTCFLGLISYVTENSVSITKINHINAGSSPWEVYKMFVQLRV